MSLGELKVKISPILLKYGVKSASVFGSVARGQENENSDIDLVVKTGKLKYGIWGFVGLKQDLEEALGKKVDLVSADAINPSLEKKIQKDLTQIYAE